MYPGGDRVGDLTQRFHSTGALQRSALRWHRQRSLDSSYAAEQRSALRSKRNTRLRKSSGDMATADADARQAALISGSLLEQVQQQQSQLEGATANKELLHSGKFETVDEVPRSESRTPSEKHLSDADEDDGAAGAGVGGSMVTFNLDGDDNEDDDDDEDEDWDVEFGFAENSEDEQNEPNIGSAGGMDATRRRSENFNIFLRNFHDMMDGEGLSDDDDDDNGNSNDAESPRRSKRVSKPAEEQLFRRKREHHPSPSLDESFDGTSRASLTSVSGATEYTLADKYRLLEVAGSSAYAVRIERYPKPCATYSNLEKDAGFASFTENKFERWLEAFVASKCELAYQVMETEREQMANPRQQKNHQFRTMVSLPFGKEFVVNFFKQVSLYRYFGEEKSNRELVRVYFEKVSTTAYAEEDWSLSLSSEDFEYIANCTMEILQEAARMYGPKPPSSSWSSSSLSFSSTASTPQAQASSSATLFWMRQFQSILQICVEAFPKYRHVIALIELRYVCHHLVGFASGDFTHTWQICNQLPAFTPTEAIAGEAAPIVANKILEHYGALFIHLNTSPESRNSWHGEVSPSSSEPTTDSKPTNELKSISFGISPDVICLQALLLCDIQCLYDSRSALAEMPIPELVELFEFEDDDMNIDPRLMELLDTEVKVQNQIPGLYTGVRMEESSRMPERRSSSGGLGGWSTESRLMTLLRPSSSSRIPALGFFYERISAMDHPLVKAKCASVLGSMHLAAGSLPNLRVAESLAYEAVRVLEACSAKKLEPFSSGAADSAEELCRSMFNNDGLLSELGREALEQLGNVLIKNQKYRYGILVLEAASVVFGFLNQGCEYEKLDRTMCRLTLEADDVQRALPLHEKVAQSAQRQGNINEYIYLTQALTNLWIREGNFARAEENLLSAFRILRDHTGVLPPSFLSFLYGSYSNSDTPTSNRSGTMMTTSTVSSSLSGSFHIPSRGNTSELDSWLNHDISLHLLVREIYRSSGRYLEGMQVLHYVLSYSSRLPRGKRTHLQMLLAEDSLKLGMLDTCRYLFAFLDREANLFCERLKENILSSTIGSSSGGGGGSSSSGGRSMGGLGSEARYCFDMVFSIRYVICRAKFYLKTGDYREAFTWLSLAHIKSDKENLRRQAQLHFLDGKAMFGLYREFYEHRRSESGSLPTPAGALSAEIEGILISFAGSFYSMSTKEKNTLEARLVLFCECARSAKKSIETGVKSFWTAFDEYQSLDDSLHQLKSLLEIVNFRMAPIEHAFFALGSSQDDDMLKSHLFRSSSLRKSDVASLSDADGNTPSVDDDDVIERTRRSVLDAQKLLRRAINLAEQVADAGCLLRTLILCSEAWIWLERIASYKNEKVVKEAAALWEEAVKLLKAVFLRRVAFHSADDAGRYNSTGGFSPEPPRGGLNGTFSVVPILNFSEGVILKLENMTLRLIFIACQLQQFERVPEYIEEMIGVHLDELLSAKMCLSSISQQLSAFREHQRVSKRAPSSGAASVGSGSMSATPRSSVSVTSSDGGRSASFTSSNSTPALHSSSGGSSSNANPAIKRKGHKKNQSMSSISELLASSGSSTPSTSFHDVSSSFGGANRGGSFLGTATTPRTGLASLNDRGSASHGKPQASGVHPPLIIRAHRGHHGFDRIPLRARGRSSSAPQQNPPTRSSKLDAFEAALGGEPHEQLTPVHESTGEEQHTRRIVDLADVSSWSQDEFRAIGEGHLHGEESSSGGIIGLYDFDEVQSEKLWWIFNMWRDTKSKFMSGKIESTSFRTQNLRYLRTLLDTFDPHQVAVLYVSGHGSSSVIPSNANNGSKGGNSASPCGIVGYDVAHINSHALIQENDLVLSIGYDVDKESQYGYSQLKFKVFAVTDGETVRWRAEIPRPEWYLKHYDLVETESATTGSGALRSLRLLGPKVLAKLLGLLLLENAVVVTGSSFPQVQEVTLTLLKLLQPFRWHHTFLPFVPITSWKFLYDSMQLYAHAQLAARPKSRKSFSRLSAEWRWGGGGSSSSSTSSLQNIAEPVDGDDPPFLMGAATETWQSCMMHARSRGDDTARTIMSYVTVVDLDNVEAFAIAKSNTNAVSLPRKWRKHFLERFDKAVKQRRKVQQKVGRRLVRQPYVPSTPGGMSTSSTMHGGGSSVHSPYGSDGTYRHLDATHRSLDDARSSRSASMWMSQGEAGLDTGSQYFVSSVVAAEANGGAGGDDRRYYDQECLAAFMTGLHEFYDKLRSICEEKEKKLKGSKKKSGGLSKRQELKAWFSSSHDFDAFADKFQESEMFLQRTKEMQLPEAGGAASRTSGSALLSAGSSSSGPRSLGPRISHQLRSAGSLSSTSSGGVGMGL